VAVVPGYRGIVKWLIKHIYVGFFNPSTTVNYTGDLTAESVELGEDSSSTPLHHPLGLLPKQEFDLIFPVQYIVQERL
jgi:hypothetical protein